MFETTRQRQMALRASVVFPGKSGRAVYSDEWYTPSWLVSALGSFDMDPCAGPMAHAATNIGPEDDGLQCPWTGRVWLNPPYSNVHEWLDRFRQHGNGITLVNARPETQWFQRLASGSSGLLWLKGRVNFHTPEGESKHPTVGSVLVAYGPSNAEALVASNLPGLVMQVTHVLK